jgi:hypothetical protein
MICARSLRRCLWIVLVCQAMTRLPDRQLLSYLAPCDPQVSDLTLALRDVVLEEAPDAIESIFKGYAVTIGFSFTGKPLKDGFCHVVTYLDHVNLGFNRARCFPILTEFSRARANWFVMSRCAARPNWTILLFDDIFRRLSNR